MADFTILLGDLIASGYDVAKIALQNYEAPSESVRQSLNTALINHYLDQEIGSETPELFAFRLRRAMDEIMPYYSALYVANAKLADFDPTKTFSEILNTTRQNETKIVESRDGTTSDDFAGTSHGTSTGSTTAAGEDSNTTTNESSGNSTGNTKNRRYDNPISGSDNGFDPNYVTNGDISENSGTDSSNSTNTSSGKNSAKGTSSSESDGQTTNKGTRTTKDSGNRSDTQNGTDHTERSGYTSAVWESVEAYRKVITNWTMQVINDPKVSNCFMLIFDGKTSNLWGECYGY